MKKNIIIVAGGKGLRMACDLPKQFIPIAGKPVLMHTIEAFYNFDNDISIVLVLSPEFLQYWKNLCQEHHFTIPHQVAFGGETRFDSVKNGLTLVSEGLVGVHDAARPFVSRELIERCFANLEDLKAVIPAVDATDSLREMLDDHHSRIIDRSKIRLIQTPQVFTVEVLKKAYEVAFRSEFTDDASVVEATGQTIHLVPGEIFNIKITTPFDLEIAKLLLKY